MWTAENRRQYARKGLRYPSDVTNSEWELVRPFLMSRQRKGSPPPERMRVILNGILYVLKRGGAHGGQSPGRLRRLHIKT